MASKITVKKKISKKAINLSRLSPARVANSHKDTIEWARKFIEKYRPALEALADK